MKTCLKLFAVISVCLLSAGALVAQTTGTVTANSSAEIVAPLVIADNSGMAGGTTLNFGRMTISPTQSGTSILSAANVRTVTNGVIAVEASTTSTASFSVNGKAGSTYAITLPAGPVAITRSGGPETMTVTAFTALPASAGVEQLTGTLVGGTDTFTVGGTLQVNANQAEGIYNGTFNVTIAYN